MIGGVLAFFASGALRLFIGEVMAFFTSKQDHAQELDRMRLQGDLDTERATQQRMAMSLQKELGVEIIEAQTVSAADEHVMSAWEALSKSTTKLTGVWLADFLNAMMRPAMAVWAIVMVTLDLFLVIAMTENTWALCGAILGIYTASRDLFKRNK
jgi:hypothetical protein